MRLSHRFWITVALFIGACAPPAKSPRRRAALVEPQPEVVETSPPEKEKEPEPEPTPKRALSGEHVSHDEYLLPPPEVVSLLERPAEPTVQFHAKSRQMVRAFYQKLFTREQMARPFLSLAGMQIEPDRFTHARRPLGTHLRINSIDKPREARELRPPEGAFFGEARFSPSGRKLAIPLFFEESIQVAVYDVLTAELRQLSTPALSEVWGAPCSWVGEDELLCTAAPSSINRDALEAGPRIYELKSGAVPARTYSGLLQSGTDDALFERYARVRPLLVQLDGDEVEMLPIEGLMTQLKLSPDGKYLLVTQLSPPYSRLVPAWKFPVQQVVYRRSDGEVVHRVNAPPEKSTAGVALGPRAQGWKPKEPAELYYVERVSTGGEATKERLYRVSAPFDSAPTLVSEAVRRVSYMGWTSAGTLMLSDGISSSSWSAYKEEGAALRLVGRGTGSNSAGEPGSALRTNGKDGALLEHDGLLFFIQELVVDGKNVQELVSYDLETKTTKRLLLGRDGEHMEVLGVLDPARFEYLITTETTQTPAKVVVSRAGRRRTVTLPPPRHPELEGVKRRVLRVRRSDGVTMPATLFLPPDFPAKKPVPTVIWMYPRGFEDPESVEQFSEESDHYFHVAGPSRLSLLTQGYALLDLPAIPIVGKVETGRDDFIPQLIDGASSAIERLVEIGVADRDRVYPMGRSYGAFAVANLLAHSRLFRTGIAMNGAYNRTLTPFGFQHETRTFWESTEAYVNLSPFFFADKIAGSLLLVHGELDENAGTPLLQSERFYAALVGNGVRARYVALPFEGHQVRGRDGVLHVAAEMIRWLDAADQQATQ